MRQLELFSETIYTFTPDITNAGTYSTTTSDGKIQVSSLKCTCCFFLSMRLPCRHIFHVRHNLGLSLFDRNLCDERWTSMYYRSNHKLLKGRVDDTQQDDRSEHARECRVEVSKQQRTKRWTSQQKFSRAMDVCKKIANTISLCSQEEFNRKFEQLTSLNEAWMNGKEIRFSYLKMP